MAAQPKPCPYRSAAALRAAIVEAGSIETLSLSIGSAPNTIRKWCKTLDVDTRTGQIGSPKTDRADILAKMTDAEVGGLLSVLASKDRLASILGVAPNTLRKALDGRDLPPATGAEPSPRAHMLAQRVRKLERDSAAARELSEAIRFSATVNPAIIPVKRAPAASRASLSPVDVILHVSDKQFGEVVGTDEVPGGGYSPEIYELERLPRYVAAVEGILRTVAAAHPIRTVWICQGGDFVEGEDVFAGHHWHLAMDAGRQVDRIGRLWSTAVAEIATEAKALGAERVKIVSVVGNHGQDGGRKAGAKPASLNYDWLAYMSISMRLQGLADCGGVDFIDEEPRRAVYFEAAGHTVLMTHGDQDKGGGLIGVPVVNGLKNDLSVRMQTEVQHRYHIKGHFHRPTQITVGGSSQTLWNGDWCGANNLSVGKGGGSHPTQHAYVMHPEHGLLASWPIRLASGALPVDVLH